MWLIRPRAPTRAAPAVAAPVDASARLRWQNDEGPAGIGLPSTAAFAPTRASARDESRGPVWTGCGFRGDRAALRLWSTIRSRPGPGKCSFTILPTNPQADLDPAVTVGPGVSAGRQLLRWDIRSLHAKLDAKLPLGGPFDQAIYARDRVIVASLGRASLGVPPEIRTGGRARCADRPCAQATATCPASPDSRD